MIKGMTGFGNTVVMSPMYAYVISPKMTTPIDLLFSLPTNGWLFLKNRQHVKVSYIGPIILLMLVGTLPGALLLKYIDVTLMKLVLGVFIVIISADMFHHKYMKHEKLKPRPWLKVVFGIGSGITVGMFGISIPIAAYLTRSSSEPDVFKGRLSAIFLIDNIIRIILYTVLGIFTSPVLQLVILLAPAVMGGMYLGMFIARKLSIEWVNKLIIAMLAILGANLAISNIKVLFL